MKDTAPTYGGFLPRAMAWLVDALWLACLTVLLMPVVDVFGTSFFELVVGWRGFESVVEIVVQFMAASALIAFWVRKQTTPGKSLLRPPLRVVDATSGASITVAQGVIRYNGYRVSLLPLGLGFFWILFDPRKQGWHDKLAGTVVVAGEASPLPGSPVVRPPRSPGMAFWIAAVVLASYSLVPLKAALALPHVGAWTVGTGTLLLLAHAAALLKRQRVAWSFSVAFFALTGLAYLLLGLAAGNVVYNAYVDGVSAEGFGGLGAGLAVGALMLGIPVALLASVLSIWLARALGRLRDSLGGVGDRSGWLVAVTGAVASFVILAWIGHEYFYRDLPRQEACAGGSAEACIELAGNKLFSQTKRDAFQLKACQTQSKRGIAVACLGLLTASRDARPLAAAEAAAVTAACREGDLDVCQSLARHLLRQGDVATAREHLDFSCERNSRFCATASDVLRKNRQGDMAHEMDRKGCERGSAESCRKLLKGLPASGDEWRRVERRACLLGSSVVCTGMIADDLHNCEFICGMEAKHAGAMCYKCAQRAAAVGDAVRSTAWIELACKRGLERACREVTASSAQAAVPSAPRGSYQARLDASASVPEASREAWIRERLAEFMPACSRVADVDYRDDRLVVIGRASDPACVSEALRGLNGVGASPELLEIQQDGDAYRFQVLVNKAPLSRR